MLVRVVSSSLRPPSRLEQDFWGPGCEKKSPLGEEMVKRTRRRVRGRKPKSRDRFAV